MLPVDAEMIRVFEKTLIGGYSCVNTRLAFDTDIFLKDAEREMVLFKTDNGQLKRFSSKIIKMDENDQYGMAMKRPLPYGCINRKNKVLSIDQLTERLKTITLEDKISHLFTVDMEFFEVNEKTLLFKETYPPIFEKKKKISPRERSTSQIMSRAQRKKGKDEISALLFNSKTHATLKKKNVREHLCQRLIFFNYTCRLESY